MVSHADLGRKPCLDLKDAGMTERVLASCQD